MSEPAATADAPAGRSSIPALQGEGRADQVRRMFDQVAPRYDFLNHFLSGGMDILWRRKTTRAAPPQVDGPIVDLCTGTGDLAIAYAKATASEQRRILGFDFCEPMVAIGQRKVAAKGLHDQVGLAVGDALNVPLPAESASVVCVAFGIRNTDNVTAATREMTRLVAPGGTVAILEFSQPTGVILGPLYTFYFRNILPRLGRLISGAKVDAYRYLPESVMAFPEPTEMLQIMKDAGLERCRRMPMTFGTVSLYIGFKGNEV